MPSFLTKYAFCRLKFLLNAVMIPQSIIITWIYVG